MVPLVMNGETTRGEVAGGCLQEVLQHLHDAA
jgi:hypothetical protein